MAHLVTVVLLINDPCSAEHLTEKILSQMTEDDITADKQFVDCKISVSPVPDMIEDSIDNDTYEESDMTRDMVYVYTPNPSLYWDGEKPSRLADAKVYKIDNDFLYDGMMEHLPYSLIFKPQKG